jgi:hypothetical protein
VNPRELAQICAAEIAHRPELLTERFVFEMVLGAIERALRDAAPADDEAPREVRHTYAPALGGVRVKLETNSRGTNVEVGVDRPRETGESFEDAATAAVEIARRARELALGAIGAPGLPVELVDGGRP